MNKLTSLFTGLFICCALAVSANAKAALDFDGSGETALSARAKVPAVPPAPAKSILPNPFLRHFITHESYEYDNKDDALKALARFKAGMERAGAKVAEAKLMIHAGSYYLSVSYSGHITFSNYTGGTFGDTQAARADMEKMIPVLEQAGVVAALTKYGQSVRDENGRMTYSYRMILASDKGIMHSYYHRRWLKAEADAKAILDKAVAELNRRGATILNATTGVASPGEYYANVEYVGEEYK